MLSNPSESFRPAPHPAVQRSQASTPIRKDFATNLLPPIEQLLSVRQVAAHLGICMATVYKWAASGVLPHVRLVNLIRVRPEDLARFITRHSNG
jgi:excisionase family DNA binding protein